MGDPPSSLPLCDTHCHLDFPRFANDLDRILKRASQAGVQAMVTIGAGRGFASNPPAVAIANAHDRIWATVGIHPHDARLMTDAVLEDLRRLVLEQPRVVAIGEIGLDYHYDRSLRSVQRQVFRQQICLARELKKPLVIHTREAEEDTVKILEEEGAPLCGGVIHCFSGTPWLAEQALNLGFFLSFSGIVTFPGADLVRGVAKDLPSDRLLVETDAPYLAPAPFRGQRNEPALVEHILRALARLRQEDPLWLGQRVIENTVRMFSITIETR
ncbi:MAG: TatD family hydrolase [Bradymonadales bacterium]|nr:TatD family hydrolase [Bradymonadales bacterium]